MRFNRKDSLDSHIGKKHPELVGLNIPALLPVDRPFGEGGNMIRVLTASGGGLVTCGETGGGDTQRPGDGGDETG